MRIFPDYRLKALKAYVSDGREYVDSCMNGDDARGLIARLEEAEILADDLQYCMTRKCNPWPCEAIKESLEAWRRAAGK